MMLIADSGSTKTDWRLIDEFNNIHQAQSIGLNPYFTSDGEMVEAMTTGTLKLFTATEVEEIHFYGSGCSSPSQISKVEKALSTVYVNAKYFVEHDLLGAARALCGTEPGIAVILGTGSNSCFFDGEFITRNVPSLGYVLGDEGSGAYIGKRFIAELLSGQAPDEMQVRFQKKFGLNRDDILQKIYMEPFPNRFLASFTKFLYTNLDLAYTKTLIHECFEAFFVAQIAKYEAHQKVPIHVVGSVGFYFNAILRDVAAKRNISLGNVLESPIAALTLYHLHAKN
jgi:glucosamine kinase